MFGVQIGMKNVSRPRGSYGFTLIELVMVIVILGVLAVVAAPRIFSNNDVNARGFHDEAIGYLRYAQKTAIAQRRTVCVGFAGTVITLTIAATPATFTCAVAGTLSGPNGNATLFAQSGVTYATPPVNFNFDGLGQPITNAGVPIATQTFQVASVNRSITVEGLTGYVHE
jgi:MSHA pilin protein MshC